jgi:hypothetical protein
LYKFFQIVQHDFAQILSLSEIFFSRDGTPFLLHPRDSRDAKSGFARSFTAQKNASVASRSSSRARVTLARSGAFRTEKRDAIVVAIPR